MRWITPPDLTTPSEGRPNDWFIGREKELADIRALAAKSTGEHVPILAAKGVSGSGKTFLARRSREILRTAGIPVVTIDYAQIGQRFDHSEFVTSLLSATGIDAPRTYVALLYLAMREHELDHSEIEEELKIEKMGAAADLFFLNIQGMASGYLKAYGTYAYKKYKLSKDPINQFLSSTQGAELKKKMMYQDHSEIRNDLMGYFADDLNERLIRPEYAVQLAVCVDSFDKAYAQHASSGEREHSLEWISHMYLTCNDRAKPVTNSRVLILCYGESDFSHPEVADHIQTLELRGFSRSDAAAYWKLKGLPEVHFESALREAKEESEGESYHVLSLDFVGEIINADPNAKFDTGGAPGQNRTSALARRFLKLQSDSDCMNLRQLALASWWDDEAAAWVFGLHERENDAIPKLHWLKRFGFVQTLGQGRFTIHGVMRRALNESSDAEYIERWQGDWIKHWASRSQERYDDYEMQLWLHKFAKSFKETLCEWVLECDVATAGLRSDQSFWLLGILGGILESDARDIKMAAVDRADASMIWSRAAAEARVGDVEALLQRALYENSRAMSYYSRSGNDKSIAGAKCNYAGILMKLQQRGKRVSLMDAMASYQEALSIYESVGDQLDCAMIQSNLAVILVHRAGINDRWLLWRAFALANSALRVYQSEGMPTECSRVLNIIGGILIGLGRIGIPLAFSNACTRLRQAVNFASVEPNPEAQAIAKNSLGNALRYLGKEGGILIYEKSLAVYEDCLEMYSFEQSPREWAMVKMNIGFTRLEISLLTREQETARMAALAFKEAEEGYSHAGLDKFARHTVALQAHCQALIISM